MEKLLLQILEELKKIRGLLQEADQEEENRELYFVFSSLDRELIVTTKSKLGNITSTIGYQCFLNKAYEEGKIDGNIIHIDVCTEHELKKQFEELRKELYGE